MFSQLSFNVYPWWSRRRMALRILVCALALVVGSLVSAHARLISVDLQSSETTFGGAPQNFTGVEAEAADTDLRFEVANVWNHLQIPQFPATTNPTFANLVDSTGANTTVSFAISGTVSAFNIFGLISGADALRGDAFYFGNSGAPPATSTSVDWTLTGLTPNTRHLVFVYGTFWDTNDNFNMFVDTDGDGDLSDETAQVVISLNRAQPSGTLFSAISDTNGVIRGRGVGIDRNQARWAGFQVVEASVVCGDGIKEGTEQCDDGNTTNGDGCSSTCQSENHPPVARCRNVTVDATATSCQLPASINNGSSDPDSGDTITLSQSLAGPYGLGNTLVTLTVTDSHGVTATCSGTVTVRDTIPPPLSCPGPVTAECAGTSTPVTFATPQPGPDNCGSSRSTGCSPTSGTGFGLGSTPVTCGATDGTNTSSCAFSVTVVDTIAPSLTCPSAQTAEATSPAGASVSFPTPSATDACTAPTVSCDTASGATFPLGTSTVHCNARDGFNSNSCSFNITVRDTTAPNLICPANVTVTVGQPISLGTPTVSDLVDPSPAVSNNAPATYPIGSTTVTWTAVDEAGNTATCAQTVSVQYPFTGFFQPVDNLPTVNSVKAGQSIPVKFSLGGNFGLSILAAGSPTSQLSSACTSGAVVDDIETVSAGGSSLTYDAATDQYTYVWKTQKTWAGQCRQLNVTLTDGTVHTAVFTLK